MTVYERSTRVQAPFEEVWDFHSGGDGLTALTPEWLHLRIERTVGPEGDPDPEVLEAGSVLEMSVRPFGVGPRQRWTSRIVERSAGEGRAHFRDEMEAGPFARWEHTHTFRAAGEGATEIHDRIVYDLPGGPLGRSVGPLAKVGLDPMFRYRHRTTKALLE